MFNVVYKYFVLLCLLTNRRAECFQRSVLCISFKLAIDLLTYCTSLCGNAGYKAADLQQTGDAFNAN